MSKEQEINKAQAEEIESDQGQVGFNLIHTIAIKNCARTKWNINDKQIIQ